MLHLEPVMFDRDKKHVFCMCQNKNKYIVVDMGGLVPHWVLHATNNELEPTRMVMEQWTINDSRLPEEIKQP